MTLKELLEDVNSELSISCAIPIKLPEERIKKIINSAKDWFYDNYQYAVEEKLIVVPAALFASSEFKGSRAIKLPSDVISIFDFREMTGAGIIGPNTGDFSMNRMMAADIYLNPFGSDALMYRTIMFSQYDLAQQYMVETISFGYNKNSKKLLVKGRTPRRDASLHAYVKLKEEDLYDDEVFRRYIKAKAKMNLGRMLGTFNFTLLGGITINFDMIKSEGSEELAEIKEEIKGEDTADFFSFYN